MGTASRSTTLKRIPVRGGVRCRQSNSSGHSHQRPECKQRRDDPRLHRLPLLRGCRRSVTAYWQDGAQLTPLSDAATWLLLFAQSRTDGDHMFIPAVGEVRLHPSAVDRGSADFHGRLFGCRASADSAVISGRLDAGSGQRVNSVGGICDERARLARGRAVSRLGVAFVCGDSARRQRLASGAARPHRDRAKREPIAVWLGAEGWAASARDQVPGAAGLRRTASLASRIAGARQTARTSASHGETPTPPSFAAANPTIAASHTSKHATLARRASRITKPRTNASGRIRSAMYSSCRESGAERGLRRPPATT